MADVLVVVKVYPEDDTVDLNLLKNEIEKKMPANYRIVKSETEPIAFGLNSLILYVQMPDAEGGTDKLEELINETQGVSNSEIINITRLGF